MELAECQKSIFSVERVHGNDGIIKIIDERVHWNSALKEGNFFRSPEKSEKKFVLPGSNSWFFRIYLMIIHFNNNFFKPNELAI